MNTTTLSTRPSDRAMEPAIKLPMHSGLTLLVGAMKRRLYSCALVIVPRPVHVDEAFKAIADACADMDADHHPSRVAAKITFPRHQGMVKIMAAHPADDRRGFRPDFVWLLHSRSIYRPHEIAAELNRMVSPAGGYPLIVETVD